MRREALRKLNDQKISNLNGATWFQDFIQKLKDQHRNTLFMSMPACCQLFLFTIKQVIEEGISITSHVFYKLLEGCITDKDDYKDVIVNKCIKLVREQKSCSVDAENFLKYLREHDIYPCPALLAQIRQQKRKAKQKEQAKKQAIVRKQMMRDRHSSSQLMSVASSAMLSNVNSRSDLDTDEISLASDSSHVSLMDGLGGEVLKEVRLFVLFFCYFLDFVERARKDFIVNFMNQSYIQINIPIYSFFVVLSGDTRSW